MVLAFVLSGLVLFVVVTYGAVVVGGGALLGRLSSPALGLSVLATAIVALAFDPVQRRLEAVASLLVDGGRPAPYEVLQRFSATVTGSHPAEELPARMARVLAEGTGAEWAQVWITVGGQPALAATWPPGAAPPVEAPPASSDGVVRSLPVDHAGELLGLLVLRTPDGMSLTPIEERLFAGLARQAGPVLRGTVLRAELQERAADLAGRAVELRASRQRLLDAQDEARRLLERDIHDGAQQHLVALAVNLRLAHTLSLTSAHEVASMVERQRLAADEAVSTLLRLARGIYPPLLTEGGLVRALEAAVHGAVVPVRIEATDVGRYGTDVEAAAYFCTLEAVQNATKHSRASVIRVALHGGAAGISVVVADDGVGFAVPGPGSEQLVESAGLLNMRDRAASVGGTLGVTSSTDAGTSVDIRLPGVRLGVAPGPVA